MLSVPHSYPVLFLTNTSVEDPMLTHAVDVEEGWILKPQVPIVDGAEGQFPMSLVCEASVKDRTVTTSDPFTVTVL
jgi:hypothetical protein